MNLKFGKKEAVHVPRRYAMAAAVLPHLADGPEQLDLTDGLQDWLMFDNNQLSDCVYAGGAHHVMCSTNESGFDLMVTPTTEEVIAAYEKWAGYNPADPNTDQGDTLDNFLNHFEAEGFCGQKLLGHISTGPYSIANIRKAMNYFGPCYMGAAITQAAMDEFDAGKIWDVPKNDGGTLGLHCLDVLAFNPQGPVLCTWGKLQQATWSFWSKYVDEAHFLLLEAWLRRYPAAQVETLLNILRAIS